MKIAIDVMAEKGVNEVIKGLSLFIKKYKPQNIIFYLVGFENKIKVALKNNHLTNKIKYKIINTTSKITAKDGILAFKRKQDASMIKALNLVKDDICDAVISGGSTPVYLTAAHYLIKELPNIARPALMPTIPSFKVKGAVSVVLDVGANLTVLPSDLLNFALLASVYYKKIYNINNPKVGLLNIGEESSKGFTFQQDAYKLLSSDSRINFCGNVEPNKLFDGDINIFVCDGYSGNIALKTLEGTAFSIFNFLKKQYKKKRNILALLFSGFIIKKLLKTFNYKNYNGALFIGLNKVVFKTHGSSDAKSYCSVIRMTYEALNNNIVSLMNKEILESENK